MKLSDRPFKNRPESYGEFTIGLLSLLIMASTFALLFGAPSWFLWFIVPGYLILLVIFFYLMYTTLSFALDLFRVVVGKIISPLDKG
jgi:MFS superfamily sulfate permease-like transporter